MKIVYGTSDVLATYDLQVLYKHGLMKSPPTPETSRNVPRSYQGIRSYRKVLTQLLRTRQTMNLASIAWELYVE